MCSRVWCLPLIPCDCVTVCDRAIEALQRQRSAVLLQLHQENDELHGIVRQLRVHSMEEAGQLEAVASDAQESSSDGFVLSPVDPDMLDPDVVPHTLESLLSLAPVTPERPHVPPQPVAQPELPPTAGSRALTSSQVRPVPSGTASSALIRSFVSSSDGSVAHVRPKEEKHEPLVPRSRLPRPRSRSRSGDGGLSVRRAHLATTLQNISGSDSLNSTKLED